jgi:hypothetical protein
MSLENLKTKLLSDPKVKAHYEEIKSEFEAACAIIAIRRKLVIRGSNNANYFA